MKLQLLAIGVALATFASQGFAYDIYRITNPHTLVTHYHGDMLTFIDLNAHSVQSKVRAFYRAIKARQALAELQPGDVVRVSNYYDDGTARIVFDDEYGYIAKDDLNQKIQ
jgi:hypothetical protein